MFCLVVGLASCGTDKGQLADVLGANHFRSNTIGDKREKVEKAAASDNLTDRTDEAISCELKVEDIELLVRYDFDEEVLYSIQADLFFPDSSGLNRFEDELIAHYNAKYGEVDLSSGFLIWQESGKVEFTLADESVEFGQPKLSLTIYNFDY